MKRILLLFLLITVQLSSFAQSYIISGTVKDKENGELIIGATISVKDKPSLLTITNEFGFFSLKINEGKQLLIVKSMGYKNDSIIVSENSNLSISLESQSNDLQEVVVTGEKSNANITNAQSGIEKLDIKEINKLPILFGEKDILKTMQLLPGVKSGGDGGGIFVRGGAGDQNLILLDDAIVYNASHLLGFFSTFNSDAIRNVDLYKGTQPAQFGGRLSSVMDIRMKDGNNQKYEVNGSLGLISSKLSIEGPIVKDKGSFFISGRRTYADLFLQLSDKYSGSKLYFYDLNLKANYRLSKNDIVYLSLYTGRDKLGLKDLFGINWGNQTATLRWNHIFNRKLFSNTSFIASEYDYLINVNFNGSSFDIKSDIRDLNFKQDFQYYINSNNKLRFGLSSIDHTILPGEVSGDLFNEQLQKQYSWENALYIFDEWKVNNWMNINAGLRYSSLSVFGDGDFYTLDASNNVIDTVHYNSGKIAKSYFIPEPRVNMSFVLSKSTSVKLGYARNAQYLHLLSNSTASSPTDKWMSSDNNIKPEIADLVSLGYFKNLHNDMYETGIEIYYKDMQNQIDYKDAADILFTNQTASQLLTGIGRAYGMEFLFKKRTGKLTGWVSYTLSRTEKKIDGINNNQWYLARQDKLHDISIVATYDLSKRINISANWVYSTGNAVTFPSGKYYVDNQLVWLYTERNGYRMPDYHRLDLGINIKVRENPHFSSELSFGIFNVYGRENAYNISFRESETDPTKTEVVQTALFKFIPSVSWNFRIK